MWQIDKSPWNEEATLGHTKYMRNTHSGGQNPEQAVILDYYFIPIIQTNMQKDKNRHMLH